MIYGKIYRINIGFGVLVILNAIVNFINRHRESHIASHLKHKAHQIENCKCFPSCLAVVFAQSIEARRYVENLDVVRAAPIQLHLTDQQFYCLLRCILYWSFDGIYVSNVNQHLLPIRRQAVVSPIGGLALIRPLGTNVVLVPMLFWFPSIC